MQGRGHGGFAVAGSALRALAATALASCGGGGDTGNPVDSGPAKTYLSVEASDADGDALRVQWRVTAGQIDNRDARQTVWTLPDGPGLHFAYVLVSDGKGGSVEQQYAVATDALGSVAAVPAPVTRAAPALGAAPWRAGRLRVSWPDTPDFAAPSGGTARRAVYLPGVDVQVEEDNAGAAVVFAGRTDLGGELSLPALDAGTYRIRCASVPGGPLQDCATGGALKVSVGPDELVQLKSGRPTLTAARNLRLFGHVALADGGVCGAQSDFFGVQTAASVQLLQSDGAALGPAVPVNRFGDYALDAGVLTTGRYKLLVRCEAYEATLDVPPSPSPLGYVSDTPVELSHRIANSRPVIVKMVANGPDGNVRGQMVVPEPGASTGLPGSAQFLAYKGQDTRLGACRYYQSLGAVADCDAQGAMQDPIDFADWLRSHGLKPFGTGQSEVAATYINRVDLNLVRRMVATRVSDDHVAFYVCNHPGPEGESQAEVDAVLDTGLADKRRVACVAMEWTATPGVNGGRPFTKFFTFGPTGRLLPSINLDGRGEKFMPGACVACHGGTRYNGRFPERGPSSPDLGAGFLPFDTGNFLFGTLPGLSEAEQSRAIHDLNQLVKRTDAYSPNPSTTRLIDGWYPGGTTTLDKQYVPQAWRDAEATKPGATEYYLKVIGGTCRTCHTALGSSTFDWDANVAKVTDPTGTAHVHFCGGTADVAVNASMPNALISRDRLAEKIHADPGLASLVTTFLGCDAPLPDPAYAKR